MAKRKRVQCFGHGAINAGPRYRCHWEDVWLRWEQPRHVIRRAAPMIGTRADLEGELFLAEERVRRYGAGHQDDVDYNRRMLALLDSQPYARDDFDCPNVYTRADYIDRAEAERMLTWFLADAYGVRRPKFVWRRSDFHINSVSFAGVQERREEAQSAGAVDPDGGSGQGGPRATDPSLAVSSSTEQTTKP